mmetsp:Transcript_15991/g.54589  ORF Transcript_15991/g.54589 Transcript_15991/m.54589 type:complete len:378 (+) Transcript_15991:259-1392(+)
MAQSPKIPKPRPRPKFRLTRTRPARRPGMVMSSWSPTRLPGCASRRPRRRGPTSWNRMAVPSQGRTRRRRCVRYGVKRRELLILNFLEKDHELKGRTNLKIPCRDRKDPTIRQVQTDEVVLQLFRNATGLGKIEAKIYLDLAKWDLNSAIDKARADDYFEECARPEAKVFAESRSVSPDSVMVHLDCARGLVDVGLLQSMDVYVVAVLVAGGDVARSQSAAAAASKEGVWAWSAAQQGSTLELAHKALEAKGVGVRFEVYAANDVVADTLVGSTASVPLERLSDGALHVVEVDTGGELSLSLGAPAHVKSKSEFVRAVAVPANPFDAFDAARAAVSIPLVTAVEVRADYDAPGGLPPPPASPCVTSPFDFMNEPNPS